MLMIIDKLNYVYSPGNAYEKQALKDIDLVIEEGRSLHLFEIKSSTSFSTDFTRNLDTVRRAIPEVASATVVYGGDSAAAVRDIEFVPFRDLAARMRQLGLA